MQKLIRVAIVAGESSGDILGASLIRALKARHSHMVFEGIAGPLMEQEGAVSLAPMERLSVMGIAAILRRLPELLRLRSHLVKRWSETPPDIFIGIDAPEFNLGLEERLKKHNITTAHYVSPSVWAWRKKRIFKIKRAVDLMLTLFPFERAIYQEHNIPVAFVGHPLADAYPLIPDVRAARAKLNLSDSDPVVAVLPGSRGSELKYLCEPYIRTMQALARTNPQLQFVVPLVNSARREQFERALTAFGSVPNLLLVDGQSSVVMTAADVVLLASGTAALEAMLLKKPMVVGYRVSGLSYFIFKRLLTLSRFSLPNLLAQKDLVPELMQADCTPENLTLALQKELTKKESERADLIVQFSEIHQSLRCSAGEKAADAISQLLKAHE